MPTFQRKHARVEAVTCGAEKLQLYSQRKGEQAVAKGDYLVTDAAAVARLEAAELAAGLPEGSLGRRGTMYAVPKAEFEAGYEAVTEDDPEEQQPAAESSSEATQPPVSAAANAAQPVSSSVEAGLSDSSPANAAPVVNTAQ